MNSKQLAVFHEVMLTGSFSEAARNLGRTQPAVSAMIATLENDLGYKLFIRRSGRLTPVPEANYLFEEAREILGRLHDVRQNMTRAGKTQRGELRIVSMPGPSVILMPQLIGRFVSDRSDVRATLLTRSSPQVQHLIATQQFDIGLADQGSQGAGDPNLLEYESFSYDSVCALPADDPLTEKPVVTPTDLKQHVTAALFPSHPTYQRTQAAFESHGVPFQPRFETQYFYPLLSYVEAGLACAVIDPLTAASYRLSRQDGGRIVFRPFMPSVSFSVLIVRPRHRPLSKLTMAFNEDLRRELIGHQTQTLTQNGADKV